MLCSLPTYLYAIVRRLTGFFEDKWLILSHTDLNASFSIKSHLTIKERVTLYRLSRDSNSILEIGSYIGASACCFGASMKKSGGSRVFCIDTWNNDAMTEGIRDTYAEFLANTASYADLIVPVRGFSTDQVGHVAAQTDHLDLLFIDGDHSYESVKADWESYKHFLRAGAVVVFHDSGWAEGVQRVINEDVISEVSSYDCLPNMWWGIIRKS